MLFQNYRIGQTGSSKRRSTSKGNTPWRITLSQYKDYRTARKPPKKRQGWTCNVVGRTHKCQWRAQENCQTYSQQYIQDRRTGIQTLKGWKRNNSKSLLIEELRTENSKGTVSVAMLAKIAELKGKLNRAKRDKQIEICYFK